MDLENERKKATEKAIAVFMTSEKEIFKLDFPFRLVLYSFRMFVHRSCTFGGVLKIWYVYKMVGCFEFLFCVWSWWFSFSVCS